MDCSDCGLPIDTPVEDCSARHIIDTPVHVMKRDKELSLEWMGNGWRFGMWIDDEEAGWFMVTKDFSIIESGELTDETLSRLYEHLKGGYEDE